MGILGGHYHFIGGYQFHNTSQDMNYYLVWILSKTDRQMESDAYEPTM